MTLKIVHCIELGPGLTALLTQIAEALMSDWTGRLDALEAAVVAAEAKSAEDVANLQAQIAELKAQVEAGTATPEEKARFEALLARVAAIDPDPSFPPTPPGPPAQDPESPVVE